MDKLRRDFDDAVRLIQRRRFGEARTIVNRLAKKAPDNPLPWNLAGVIASELGRQDRAIESFRKAVALAPGDPDFQNNLGEALRKAGRIEESLPYFETALTLEPRHAAAHNNIGAALTALGRTDKAAPHFAEALRLRPDNPETLTNLGMALMSERKPDKAIPCFERARALRPDDPILLRHLGRALEHSDRFEDALALFERAEANGEADTAVTVDQVNNLDRQGRFDEAWDKLAPLLDAEPDSAAVAREFAMLARRVDRREEARERLLRVLARADLDDETREALSFQLGTLSDSLGLYDEAFAAYRTANDLDPRPYDHAERVREEQALARVYAPGWEARLGRATNRADAPVFIVGMPRSGTSLVEQILASHPAVHGAGELPHIGDIAEAIAAELPGEEPYPDCMPRADAALLDRHAERHLRFLAEISSGAERVTDKLPHNFRHLGLIEQLFPKARIIHCTRDPLDVCLSCYFQNFYAGHGYAYDLASLGAHYRLYERIMEHWLKASGLAMLEVRYEALVADQERVSREMIAFLDLAWDERCLRFHESKRRTLTASYDQVRRPVYRAALARHKNYEKHLGPLREARARDGDGSWADTGAVARLFESGVAAQRQGDTVRAEIIYNDILKRAPRHAGALTQLGLIEQARGRLESAQARLEMAARVDPTNPTVRNNHGQVLLALGRAREAEAEFAIAVQHEPAFAPGWHNGALALAAQGRFEDAVRGFRKTLELNPDDPQALVHLGRALAETGALAEARGALARAAELQPAVPHIHLGLGDVLMHLGEIDGAIASYREVARLVPGEPAGPHRLGLALAQAGEIDEAIAALESAVRLAPGAPALVCELANACAMAGDVARARALFREASSAAPALAARGLASAGDANAARALLAPLLDASSAEPEAAIAAAEVAENDADLEHARALLIRALEGLAPVPRRAVLFALAQTEHRLGAWDSAFRHLEEANRLKHARFDAATEAALVDRIVALGRPEAAVAEEQAPPHPVFVVGMQRAGLRLVEQMLAAHPEVEGLGPAGLLLGTARALGGPDRDPPDEETVARAAARHRARLAARAPEARWAVEAVPGNVFHLGLAARLFADARVVLCRREPLNACLSCYFEDFAGASAYAYGLADLGAHYRSVARLIAHWRETLALPMIEVSFERLIADPVAAASALLDNLGLPPHPACAAAVDPVRAARRRRHEPYRARLGPLIEALSEPAPA